MNKTMIRVSLAVASLALLATSMFGQFTTSGDGCSTTTDCPSCCASALVTSFNACFAGSGDFKNLGSCISAALQVDTACLNACPDSKVNKRW